ncbi:MAG: hypothetical protein ABSA66_10385 [Roseiarcus sp.]|jgi:hypothetical protein
MQNNPLTAAGSRELKRPRPISPKVREAVRLMVYGQLDDPDCKPLSFIEAAKIAGVAPDVMRRYLDRPDVRALLLRERRAFRAALCAGNEGALARVRDKSENGMAIVASVRALEQLEGESTERGGPGSTTPGITIMVLGNARQEAPPMTIEARSLGVPYVTLPEPAPEPPPDMNPIFKP